jgi:5-formyltetrahydrofolate cyclo-ligase
MAYYPLRGEVDILRMIRKDLSLKRFCFPVIDLVKKEILPYEVKNLEEDFVRGPYSIMQPNVERTKKVDIGEIDMVIVPGLAFDRKYNRLGRGAGFYDYFLKRLRPPAKKVGIGFSFQILEDLPIHPAVDEKVDIIVSDSFSI